MLYGKTRDHVLELKTVLLDGTGGTPRRGRRGTRRQQRRTDRSVRFIACSIAFREQTPRSSPNAFPSSIAASPATTSSISATRRAASTSIRCSAAPKERLASSPRRSSTSSRFPAHGPRQHPLRELRRGPARRGALMKIGSGLERDDRRQGPGARARAIHLASACRNISPTTTEGPAQGVNLVEFLGRQTKRIEAKLARVTGMLLTPRQVPRPAWLHRRAGRAAVAAIWDDAQEVRGPARQHAG